MVRGYLRSARNRRGKTRLGCLFSLLVVATVAYYGVDLGTTFFKRWQLIEEMKAQAGFAPSIDDAAIQRRIHRKIETLGLPTQARANLRIRRSMRPREIAISTRYPVTFVLPFYVRSDTLNIEVRRPI
ncbi:hypothetical protein ACFL3B_02600 [Gemmatimonadota bacterium]